MSSRQAPDLPAALTDMSECKGLRANEPLYFSRSFLDILKVGAFTHGCITHIQVLQGHTEGIMPSVMEATGAQQSLS